jgi:hypothetical protein
LKGEPPYEPIHCADFSLDNGMETLGTFKAFAHATVHISAGVLQGNIALILIHSELIEFSIYLHLLMQISIVIEMLSDGTDAYQKLQYDLSTK